MPSLEHIFNVCIVLLSVSVLFALILKFVSGAKFKAQESRVTVLDT